MKKNSNLTKKSKSTVDYLINTLERGGFEPVIARNYENYPDFDHDLDLFLTGNPGIGKTTAITEFLKQPKILDEGFLFFYISPRIQVNLDIIEKFTDINTG